jgi:hypothetical protein
LGGDLDEQDLLELGEHRCYARVSVDGERLPAFSVHLDRPPEGDPVLAARLAAVSAARYGRARAAVEQELRAALARIEASSQEHGVPQRRARSEHRAPPKGDRITGGQVHLSGGQEDPLRQPVSRP